MMHHITDDDNLPPLPFGDDSEASPEVASPPAAAKPLKRVDNSVGQNSDAGYTTSSAEPSPSSSPDTPGKSMSRSEPTIDLPPLDGNRDRSSSPQSKSGRSNRRSNRRQGIMGSSSSPRLKSSVRRSGSYQRSATNPEGSKAKREKAATLTMRGAASAEEMAAIREDAARVMEQVEKRLSNSGREQNDNEEEEPAAVKRDSEGIFSGGLGFSTGTLGRMFEYQDEDEEVGNYPMPQSLASRDLQKHNLKGRHNSNKRGSDSSESSSIARFVGMFTSSVVRQESSRALEEEVHFQGGHQPALGSTMFADRNDPFRKSVDQSVNLMDASSDNTYGGSPERRGSPAYTNSNSSSFRSNRERRSATKKRGSILEMVFGTSSSNEPEAPPRRGRKRDPRDSRKKSMVDITLEPSPSEVALARQMAIAAKLANEQSSKKQASSCWSKNKKLRYWCLVFWVLVHLAAAIGALAALVLHVMGRDDNNSPNSGPAVAPTAAPTLRYSAPLDPVVATISSANETDAEGDNALLDQLESMILQFDLTSQDDLLNPQSSAHQAWQWLSQFRDGTQIEQDIEVDDGEEQDAWKDHQMDLERYVLAVLYYATHPYGDQQSNPSLRSRRLQEASATDGAKSEAEKEVLEGQDWIKDEFVCKWRGIRCNQDGIVTHVKLHMEHLHGTIPSEIRGLKNLVELDLSRNNLHGTIPPAIGELTGLGYLDLKENKLKGTIPDTIGALTKLHEINVAMNDLEGSLPETLQDMPELEYIFMSNNQLDGSIPPLTGFPKLVEIDLSDNDLSGPLPPSIGDLPVLNSLKLHDNRLTGPFPSSWSKLSHIESIVLHHNDIGGSLPAFLSQMTTLRDLRLNHNMLTETIPELSALKHLAHLHLNNNDLSGSIPPMTVDNLKTLLLFENSITGDASSICSKDVSKLQRFAADCKSEVSCECCQECF